MNRRGGLALLILVLVGYIMARLVLQMPEFGSESAPANTHIITRYFEQGVEETGATNIVSSILMDYRAYDTLGEATVLFTAVLAILSLLGDED
jgi:multisubunit Na+/H+ antiporter MnhB subunit